MSIRRILTAVAVSALLATAFTAPAATASIDSSTDLGAPMKNGTGLCLDGSLTRGVRLMDCSPSSFQLWNWILSGPIWAMAYGRQEVCLDGSISQGVRLAPCDDDSVYQKWSFLQLTGQYRSRADDRYCLDGSRSQGVRLALCDRSSGYQNWTFN